MWLPVRRRIKLRPCTHNVFTYGMHLSMYNGIIIPGDLQSVQVGNVTTATTTRVPLRSQPFTMGIDSLFLLKRYVHVPVSLATDWEGWGGGGGTGGGGVWHRHAPILFIFSFLFSPTFIFSFIIFPPSFFLPCFFQTTSTSALFRDTLAHRHTCKDTRAVGGNVLS